MIAQMKNNHIACFSFIILVLVGCASSPFTLIAAVASPTTAKPAEIIAATITEEVVSMPDSTSTHADVLSVRPSGEVNAYQFNVEVASPDTGCDQYADWREDLSEDGQLLYRRVLLHSHVGEQPFTRSGGPISIPSDTVVYVRAHMNTTGYGGQVLRGSVANGFEVVEMEAGFAPGVETQSPLPDGCAF